MTDLNLSRREALRLGTLAAATHAAATHFQKSVPWYISCIK